MFRELSNNQDNIEIQRLYFSTLSYPRTYVHPLLDEPKISPPSEGASPLFLLSVVLKFEAGGDRGGIGDILRLIVIHVEFLDFVFSPLASLVRVTSIW
jgi:hypothetical protein